MGLFNFIGDAIAEIIVAPIKITEAVIEIPEKVIDKLDDILNGDK